MSRKPSVTIQREVDFSHVDHFHICGYPRYAEFMGSAVMALLDTYGVTAELEKLGLETRMIRLEVHYRRVAVRKDLLDVTATLDGIGQRRLRFIGAIRRAGEVLADAEMDVVLVGAHKKAGPIPPTVRRRLADHPDKGSGRNAA